MRDFIKSINTIRIDNYDEIIGVLTIEDPMNEIGLAGRSLSRCQKFILRRAEKSIDG